MYKILSLLMALLCPPFPPVPVPSSPHALTGAIPPSSSMGLSATCEASGENPGAVPVLSQLASPAEERRSLRQLLLFFFLSRWHRFETFSTSHGPPPEMVDAQYIV